MMKTILSIGVAALALSLWKERLMSQLQRLLLAASLAIVAIPVANATTIVTIDDRTDGNGGGVETATASATGIIGVFSAVDLLIVVRDPGTTNVSDIITLIVTPHAGTTDFTLVFTSDGENGLAAPAPPPASVTEEFITETGAFQTIYSSVDANNGTSDLIFRFASDVEAVPEPATLALLGLGLAGLGFSRRKRT